MNSSRFIYLLIKYIFVYTFNELSNIFVKSFHCKTSFECCFIRDCNLLDSVSNFFSFLNKILILFILTLNSYKYV